MIHCLAYLSRQPVWLWPAQGLFVSMKFQKLGSDVQFELYLSPLAALCGWFADYFETKYRMVHLDAATRPSSGRNIDYAITTGNLFLECRGAPAEIKGKSDHLPISFQLPVDSLMMPDE